MRVRAASKRAGPGARDLIATVQVEAASAASPLFQSATRSKWTRLLAPAAYERFGTKARTVVRHRNGEQGVAEKPASARALVDPSGHQLSLTGGRASGQRRRSHGKDGGDRRRELPARLAKEHWWAQLSLPAGGDSDGVLLLPSGADDAVAADQTRLSGAGDLRKEANGCWLSFSRRDAHPGSSTAQPAQRGQEGLLAAVCLLGLVLRAAAAPAVAIRSRRPPPAMSSRLVIGETTASDGRRNEGRLSSLMRGCPGACRSLR